MLPALSFLFLLCATVQKDYIKRIFKKKDGRVRPIQETYTVETWSKLRVAQDRCERASVHKNIIFFHCKASDVKKAGQ